MSPLDTFPDFDENLGALNISIGLASILYGVGCLQMFLYTTSRRSEKDQLWLKLFSWFIFVLETFSQASLMGMGYSYFKLMEFFIASAPVQAPVSDNSKLFSEMTIITAGCVTFLVRMSFCWRIWMFNELYLKFRYRILLAVLMVALALLSLISVIMTSLDYQTILDSEPPNFLLVFKLCQSSTAVLDFMITISMSFSLLRSRGSKRTNRVIKFLIVFIVNTNLTSTLLSTGGLVTVLVFPKTKIYSAFVIPLPNVYLNSFLGVLNSREYLQKKLIETLPTQSFPVELGVAQHIATDDSGGSISFAPNLQVSNVPPSTQDTKSEAKSSIGVVISNGPVNR